MREKNLRIAEYEINLETNMSRSKDYRVYKANTANLKEYIVRVFDRAKAEQNHVEIVHHIRSINSLCLNPNVNRSADAHPLKSHVVQFVKAIESPKKLYIVYEAIPGGHMKIESTFGDGETADILRQLCKGLLTLEKQGLVHPALQADRIFIDINNRVHRYIIGGLWHLRTIGPPVVPLSPGSACPAPETLLNAEYTTKINSWSLGVIAVQLLTTKMLNQINPAYMDYIKTQRLDQLFPHDKFAPETLEFLQMCLQYDPKKRASIAELQKDYFLRKRWKRVQADKMHRGVEEEDLPKGKQGPVKRVKFLQREIARKTYNVNQDNKKAVLRELDARERLSKVPLEGAESHIVKLLEIYRTEDHFVLDFEFCHGGSLVDETRRQLPGGEPRKGLPLYWLKKLARELALGIKELHSAHIAHRDLKPDNIMLTSKNRTNTVCKIIDLGQAKLSDSNQFVSRNVGNEMYSAPEQSPGCSSTESYDNKIDVWAYGVIIYQLAYGEVPSIGRSGIRNFPYPRCASINDLLAHCLEINPQYRFTIEEVLNHEFFQKAPIQRKNLSPYYEELEPLGKGKYATVWKVREVRTGYIFAMKKMPSHSDHKLLDNEYNCLERVNGLEPFVQLYDYFTVPESSGKVNYCFVVNLCDDSLGKYCSDSLDIPKPLPTLAEDELQIIACDIARAIDEIQNPDDGKEPLCHKDLKPDNVLLLRDTTTKRLKAAVLGDFGFTRAIKDQNTDMFTSTTGTKAYLPPEVICRHDDKKDEKKLDIWSFGMTLLTICNHGQHLLKEDSEWTVKLGMIQSDMSFPQTEAILSKKVTNPSLREVIRRCLVVDPSKRWSIHQLRQLPYLQRKSPRSSGR